MQARINGAADTPPREAGGPPHRRPGVKHRRKLCSDQFVTSLDSFLSPNHTPRRLATPRRTIHTLGSGISTRFRFTPLPQPGLYRELTQKFTKRLTFNETHLLKNHAPLRSKRISLLYLLLSPRSALKASPRNFTIKNIRFQESHAATARAAAPRSPLAFTPSYKQCAHVHFALLSSIGLLETTASSALHFRDRFIRQVSCYTLLGG